MVNYCPHCGWRVLDPSTEQCGGCRQPLRADDGPGLLKRLWSWFVAAAGSPNCVVRTENITVSRRSKYAWTDPETGEQHESDSPDAMPPEIRRRVESLLEGQSLGSLASTGGNRYTFQDCSGQEQTFNSIEEMPPEIHEMFEKARRRGLGEQ